LEIAQDYKQLANKLGIKDLKIIPVSALAGDNIVDRSEAMPWYTGVTMLDFLENVNVLNDLNLTDARMSVQYVLRPQTEELHDYRGYAGRIQSGVFKKGDSITVLPSEQTSQIAKIEIFGQEVEAAVAPQSITILLETDVDISRGDLISGTGVQPILSQDVEATICWMDDRKELKVGNKYVLQHGTSLVRCSVKGIEYRIDINNYNQLEDIESLKLNDVAKIRLRTAKPLAFDSYLKNRANGAAILIDETSNVTVGACMVEA